nr:L,D-transpeptidase [Polyangiaceae bacterium]
AGVSVPELPHARQTVEGGRTRIDLVYPIATGEKASYVASAGTYKIQDVRPYRPDSVVNNEFGSNLVPWGGFPFINYKNGIALHGPISSEVSKSGGLQVFYLRRGKVSHGCNRMLGEHVVEMTHALGLNMRKMYNAGTGYSAPSDARVVALPLTGEAGAVYDMFGANFIDVDYPTDVSDPGAIRPGKKVGHDRVAMFGSWIASETPDGSDFPRDQKWEGGVKGDLYNFSEHLRSNWVCSVPKADLARVAYLAKTRGGELPKGFCEKKACILDALVRNVKVKDTCGI